MSGKLEVLDHGTVREVRLRRPDVHNAFDAELIGALAQAFSDIAREVASRAEHPLRCVLLSSEGTSFCAGADINYMKSIASFGEAENEADALGLSRMFQSIRSCPVYVLARVQGATLGGGTGLVAASDRAVASSEAVFGFTEVRLGIVPAVISPFVIERIGVARARVRFPTGERFSADEALRIGLVDEVVPPGELDARIESIVDALHQTAPGAAREAKRLALRVGRHPLPSGPEVEGEESAVFAETAAWIARLRGGPEGQEGMSAFLERRKPYWHVPSPFGDPKRGA